MTIKFIPFKTDFHINLFKWIQSSRNKETASAPLERAEQHLKVPLTPFRRNRSRVFYASDAGTSHSPEEGQSTGRISPKDTLRIKISAPSNTLMRRCKVGSGRSLAPSHASHQTPEEITSSADEAPGNFCSEDSSPVCSPTGSWRGSDRSSSNGSWRGSPSQRSQDSGYSDSGESNAGGQNETEEALNQPPQVRHITRIYFGDCNRQTSTCDKSNNTDENEFSSSSFVPKTSYTTTPRTVKVGKRRNSSINTNSPSTHSPVNNIQAPNTLDITTCHNRPIKSPCSPTTSLSSDLEEKDEIQLEHKSLSDVSVISSTPQSGSNNKKLSKSILKTLLNDQRLCQSQSEDAGKVPFFPNGKTSSRNYRKVSQGKRGFPRRSKSNDKLLEEDEVSVKPRRYEPLKARRRWSSSDLDRCSSRDTNHTYASIENFGVPHNATFPFGGQSSPQVSTTPLPRMSPFKVAEDMGNTSLMQWLGELIRLCESECMNTLQSKSLHMDPPPQGASAAHATLASIQKRAHVVSAEFALLCQRLEQLQLDQVPALVRSLVTYVQTFIHTHCNTTVTDSKYFKSKASLKHQVRVVDQICDRLIEFCSESLAPPRDREEGLLEEEKRRCFGQLDIEEEEEEDEKKEEEEAERDSGSTSSRFERRLLQDGEINRGLIREFVQIVTALGHAFTKLVDILLSNGMKTLVAILEEEEDERGVESAITEITALGVNGGHVCRLVGRVGGIRALLGVCVEPRFKRIRPLALRALATVCCVAEGISFFEKEGGVDVISEVLCDSQSVEEERSEAAGVLAQITSPWVEDNHSLPCLKGHIKDLVMALTDLAKSTTSAEVFLLTSAALANLTFLDPSCIDALLSSSTHKILLQTAQTEEYTLSVFTKDQIATILANMSSTAEAAKQVVEAGGVDVLLSLLQTGPSDSVRPAEVAATERVQQKSAIALSRICTDPEAANQVLTSGGAARLVHLCKNEAERNQSDAVLVACLAALRKIATSCGHEELRQVDASELIEPRLLDSFLIYSSQQESFV